MADRLSNQSELAQNHTRIVKVDDDQFLQRQIIKSIKPNLEEEITGVQTWGLMLSII